MNRLFTLLITIFISTPLFSQVTIHRDPEIAGMVAEVSSDSLKSYVTDLVSFGTRHLLSNQSDSKKGIGAARNYVLRRFNQFAQASGGRMTCFIDTTTLPADGKRVNRPVLLGNVMAILKGTNPADKRVFIISGHLDSRRINVMDSVGDAPGANDDASGVVAVMECARIMSRHAFSGTVIFVAVSGEEQGLLGSAYLAQRAKDEGWDVRAVLNNDIVGSNNSTETHIINNTQFRVFSEGIPHYETEKQIKRIISLGLENDGASRQLARYVKEVGERYTDNLTVMLEYRTDRFLRGGDHLPFLERGMTAVRLTEMNENFNHQHQDVRIENGVQYGDLATFMDFEYLRKNTCINLSTLANLAKAPGAPGNVVIEVRNLSNESLLRWKAPEGQKAAGFYVLMRPTAESMWTKKFFTKETKIRLPYSKDNYFFAVQSVSESGNESLPIVPVPGR